MTLKILINSLKYIYLQTQKVTLIKNFKYVNYKNIKLTNNVGNYKNHSFQNFYKLKVEKQNNLLDNSGGEIIQ